MSRLLDFFKDKNGKVVVAQSPNSPLIGFILFAVLDYFWTSSQPKVHHLFGLISFGFIFTWAWLEIISGVNYFRRILGAIVLIVILCLRFT